MNPWHFPRLRHEGYRETSPADPSYNCIAYAASPAERRWWWPCNATDHYWPPGVPDEETLAAFIAAYATLGYAPCDGPEFEEGYEKVAIYVSVKGVPTHAARQIGAAMWTSKIGSNRDIEHNTLEGLVGPLYGTVAQVLKRSKAAIP